MYDELMKIALGEGMLLEDIEAHGHAVSDAARNFAELNPNSEEQLRETLGQAAQDTSDVPVAFRTIAEQARATAISKLTAIPAATGTTFAGKSDRRHETRLIAPASTMTTVGTVNGKGSWTIRPADVDDARGIAALFETVFGVTRPASYGVWKFDENPAGPPITVVAEDAGRIVGQYMLLPTPLRLGKQRILGAQSLDTMTHPDYRGQGMFTLLANESFSIALTRGVEALYGFPNENSLHGFIRRLNWDYTGDVGTWARPLHLGLHHRVPPALKPVANLASAVWPSTGTRRFEMIYASAPIPGWDALLQQSSPAKDACSIDRSAEWIQWRYSANSGANYEWVGATAGGVLLGCVVWGTDLRNGNAVVVDYFGAQPDALRAALSAAMSRARAGSHPIALSVTQYPLAEQALRSCGFVRVKRLPLIVRSMTARTLGANIHDHAAWRIVGGDLDTQ